MANELSGYGAVLNGSVDGDLVGVQDITIGGLTVNFATIKEVSDTNRIPLKLPLDCDEAPIELRFTFRPTVYEKLRDRAPLRTEQTFTLTDSGSSTYVGTGYVAHVGGKVLGTEGESVFNVTLQPKTSWDFTA